MNSLKHALAPTVFRLTFKPSCSTTIYDIYDFSQRMFWHLKLLNISKEDLDSPTAHKEGLSQETIISKVSVL
jgi:hypothetical protein